jgi:hypothetical protein
VSSQGTLLPFSHSAAAAVGMPAVLVTAADVAAAVHAVCIYRGR